MSYRAHIADRDISVEIMQRRPRLHLNIADQSYIVVENTSEAATFDLTLDGTTYQGWRYVIGKEVHVRLGKRTFIVRHQETDAATEGPAGQQHETRADMPGVVVAVHCEAGQTVAPGDRLLTIESMKLQATLVASHEAVVERMHVTPETAFERGTILVSFVKP
jgi:3-methylcrotonyl-CoA carboxylase alpha subunit